MKAQKCPKCDGQGTVAKPPWVPGDVHEWTSGETGYTCTVCNGSGIIYVPDEH